MRAKNSELIKSGQINCKGWLVMSKLKKIWQGLVGFGCNLAQMIAHWCRSYGPVGTQIQQRQQSKLSTLHYSPPGKKSLLGCKLQTKKAFFMMIVLVVMQLSWFSCNHVSPSLKVVGITLFPKDPYDTFGCMNTFTSLLLGKYSFYHASPSLKVVGITLFPKDPYDTLG